MEIVTGKISLTELIREHWKRYLAWKGQAGQFVREAVRYHVNRVLTCRTSRLGARLYRCPNCDLIKIVPHCCHSPFCNSCGTARAQDWGDRVLSEMLDVPYRHIVLSLGWRLRLPVKDNRERLLPLLMRLAADSVLALTRGDPEPVGYRGQERMAATKKPFTPGIQVALHTFGGKLNWNVHLHLLVTCGGLSPTGEWIDAPPNSLLSVTELGTEFKLRVCDALEAEHETTPLILRRMRSDRRRRLDMDSIFGRARGERWYVYVGPSLEDPSHALKYCGRYTRRPAIGETRLTRYDGRFVTFYYKDYRDNGKRKYMKLPVLVFLDRLFQHIPEKGARPFLSYGLFASRVNTHLLAQARQALGQKRGKPPAAPSWELRRILFGDPKPLACPQCGSHMQFFMEYFGKHEQVGQLVRTPVNERIPYRTYIPWDHFLAYA